MATTKLEKDGWKLTINTGRGDNWYQETSPGGKKGPKRPLQSAEEAREFTSDRRSEGYKKAK